MGQTNPKEAIWGGLTHVKPTDLVKALSETAQFGSFRERQTFIRLTASEEAWRTLQRWLDWEGPALVVTLGCSEAIWISSTGVRYATTTLSI